MNRTPVMAPAQAAPSGFPLARGLLFLLGLLLLALPPVALRQARESRLDREREAAVRDAAESGRMTLERLRSAGLAATLLEERLAGFGQEVSASAEERPGGDAPEGLRVAAVEALGNLKAAGLHPLAVLVMHQRFLPERAFASEPFVLQLVMSETGVEPEYQVLGDILRYFTHYNLVPGDLDERFQPTERAFLEVFGGGLGVKTVSGTFRGACAPVTFLERPCLLFWQTLQNAQRVGRLRETMSDAQIRQRGSSDFTYEAQQRSQLGSFLILLSRDVLPSDAALVTHLHDDPTTEYSLLPIAGGKALATRGFGATPFAAPASSPSEWVLSTGTTVLEEEYQIQIAAQVRVSRPDGDGSAFWLDGLAIVGAVAGVALWAVSVFGGRALAASLVGQLWWGFLLASLLPLTFVLWLGFHLEAERLDSLREETRLGLRRVMEDYQGRFTGMRYRAWDQLASWTHDPELYKSIQQAQQAHLEGRGADDPALSAHRRALERLFEKTRQKVCMSQPNSLVVAGIGGFSCEVNQQASSDQGVTGKLLARLAEGILTDRNPRLRTVIGETVGMTKGVKDEVALETVEKLMLAVSGPDGYYHLMLGHGRLLTSRVGLGISSVMQFLLPDARWPQFIALWLVSMRKTDRRSISHSLAGQQGPFQVYAMEQSRVGSVLFPWEGEILPYVRAAARRVRDANRPLSLTYTYRGETFLVEAAPPPPLHQFLTIGVAPEGPLRAEAEDLPRRLRLLAGLALVMAFLTALAVARDLVRPVLELVAGLERVWHGDFSWRVSEERRDELGELCVAYNDMAKGLEESRLLGKMVSTQARQAVLAGSGESSSEGGDRREVVVLYLDPVGVEEILVHLSPEEVIGRLDRQIRRVCEVIGGNGGDVDKIMGGKVLAVFPVGPDGVAPAAGRALRVVFRLAADHQEGGLPFPVRVGVSCGPVIAGFLGTANRRDFTIIGDTVNLAARCAGVARELHGRQIVITGDLRGFLGEGWEVRLLPTTTVKGKEEPVELYQVVGGAAARG